MYDRIIQEIDEMQPVVVIMDDATVITITAQTQMSMVDGKVSGSFSAVYYLWSSIFNRSSPLSQEQQHSVIAQIAGFVHQR